MPVDTPHLVVDPAIMQRNIERFQQAATDAHVGFRPHIKTHKSSAVARLQLEAGAVGLTCATLSEAVGLSAAGVGGDVFVAVPHYPTSSKLARIDQLLTAGCFLSLAVDDSGVALSLARRYGDELSLMVEVDSGLARTGVSPARSVDVARACGDAFGGVFTHGGHGYPPAAAAAAGADEVRCLAEAKDVIEAAGMSASVLSAGSTPTFLHCLADPVNEVRPGTYVFGDWQQVSNGAMGLGEVAARVVATIISTTSGRFVLDAGAKILTKDQAPWVVGFGHIPSMPGAIVRRIYDNQAVVELGDGPLPTIGEQVEIVPNHICPVVNLVDEISLTDGASLAVDLRGHLS